MKNNLEEYIIKILNDNKVKKINDNEDDINEGKDKNITNLENEDEINEINFLFSNDELFKNLIKEYEFETNNKLIIIENNIINLIDFIIIKNYLLLFIF